MQEQLIIGDRLWDEILKAIIYVMPKQLFPLIKEVYGKEYPPDTPVKLLGTEHSTYLENPESPPSSRLMDLSLLIANSDYYHIECQMKNDKFMVIRMVSYDLHYAIRHCMSEGDKNGELVIRFPRSAVLCPDQNKNLPDSLRCRIIFHDGSEHIYSVPTVKIQSYPLDEIRRKHLELFVPYLLLRLKPRIASKTHPLTKKHLTEFVSQIILLLEDDMRDGYLTPQECGDYVNLLQHASRHLFYHQPTFHEEVLNMTKPLIYLPSMRIMDLETMLAEKDSKFKTALVEKDSALAERDSALAENARLRAELAALSSR